MMIDDAPENEAIVVGTREELKELIENLPDGVMLSIEIGGDEDE